MNVDFSFISQSHHPPLPTSESYFSSRGSNSCTSSSMRTLVRDDDWHDASKDAETKSAPSFQHTPSALHAQDKSQAANKGPADDQTTRDTISKPWETWQRLSTVTAISPCVSCSNRNAQVPDPATSGRYSVSISHSQVANWLASVICRFNIDYEFN